MDEASTPAQTFFELEEERDYQAAQALLVNPPRMQQRKVQILLFSLLAFAAASLLQDASGSLIDLAMLIGVILFHELGHMIAMQLFGYRDVKIFFIPFFGGAATGRKRGVARWKEGVVLLCGPIPGIVAGVVLAYLGDAGYVRVLALQLLLVNGLNLLPVMPLDGGQLFQLALFSRHRYLEIVFFAVTTSLLTLLAFFAELWVLAIFGAFLLAGVPHRKRILETAHRVRDCGWPDDPATLDDAQRRELYRVAMEAIPADWRARWRGKPQPKAQIMEQVLERATQRPPSTDATVGLLAVWLVALVAALAGIALTVGPKAHTYTNAEFTVELPVKAPAPTVHDGWHVLMAADGANVYSVTWGQPPDPQRWLEETGHDVVEARRATVVATTLNERRYAYQEGGTRGLVRLVVAGKRVYMIGAFNVDDAQTARRFVDSFRLLEW